MPLPSEADTARKLQALAERWAGHSANERAAFQSWMLDLLEALGSERPVPPTPEHQFELPVRVVDREGRASVKLHRLLEGQTCGGRGQGAGQRD